MDVKRQQGGADQMDLFDEALKARCATTPAGKAEPDLGRLRSRKRPRHGNMNEP